MKRAGLVLAICLMSALACAVLVDDFESYNTGTIDTVTSGAWVTSPAPTAGTPTKESIAVDPSDSLNKVLDITTNGSAQIGAYGVLTGNKIVTDGATKTLKLKFYTTATTCDTSFGLTTVDVPNGFANFLVQCFINKGNFGARNAGTATTLTTWTANTWYYLWVVINNSTNTYDIYLKTTPANATTSDRLAAGFAFRTIGTSNPDGDMDRFYAIGNYGAGVTGGTRELFDDITIVDGTDLTIAPSNRPYGGSAAQTANGSVVNVTLSWKAGKYPAGVYVVNPDIVNQYVFVGFGTDPNLYYKGATDVDPGTTTPDSQFLFNGMYDTSYRWAVVEAMTGHTQSLTVGVSDLADVDPNNITGPTWTFNSLSSVPAITQEPSDVRVFGQNQEHPDPNAAFTVGFSSVNSVTATWYKNGAAVTPDGTRVIVTVGAASSRLEIKQPVESDEGKYYCIISNQPGTADDKQTGTYLLTIKKPLAKFNFEQNLSDSSGNAAPTGIMKTVPVSDPNEDKATVVALPSYVAGIQGYAISLDGTQFIDLGTGGYPKAGPLDTTGDIRGTAYEKTGFGRGMEQGSISCWVKQSAFGAIYMNANGSDDTHFGFTTTSATAARMIMRGRNYDDTYQELGTAAGTLNMTNFSMQDGNWHMVAATWMDSTVTLYIDGEQVATGTTGLPEKYTAWERANIVGASRTAGTRQILNSLLTGTIDNLIIYNYAVPAADIITEYMNLGGNTPCANHSFTGSAYNFDNSASSYCKIDLGDFLVFADNWLLSGLYGQ